MLVNTEINPIEYKQELNVKVNVKMIAFFNYHEDSIIFIDIDKHYNFISINC